MKSEQLVKNNCVHRESEKTAFHPLRDLSSEVYVRRPEAAKIVRMKDLYLYLHSRDSLQLHKNNNPSECWIQLPKLYSLEGRWECGLIDISLDCDFVPKSSRLYLCGDFVEESYVRETSLPVLRHIEVTSRYKKVKYEAYTHPIYVPVKTVQLRTLRLRIVDENLKPVVFNTNDLHCVLHLKQTWAP